MQNIEMQKIGTTTPYIHYKKDIKFQYRAEKKEDISGKIRSNEF